MILCIDVGNSQIYGGVLKDEKIILRFRHDTKQGTTSDQIGIFLKAVLRENNINDKQISKIAVCSVVPHMDYSLRSACRKYFGHDPFVLQAGVKTGLKIKYRNPLEVGADRIANSIAALHYYPDQPVIIIDFGTATTFCAISAKKEYLGGVIQPGMRLSMEALGSNTAKLSPVPIVQPDCVLGRSTMESIQSGLYYSQLATIRDITQQITQDCFNGQQPVIIGTGGFAHLFAEQRVFTTVLPDLVLQGLRLALALSDE